MKREGFSTRELAGMKLPGAPGSHQGWEKHAVTHGWEIRQHPGRGRGGIVREFIPPPELAALITSHLAGKKVDIEEVRLAMGKTASGARTTARSVIGPRFASVRKASMAELGSSRFAAWLMARMLADRAHVSGDQQLMLDQHELAMRLLMLVAGNERCALAALADHPAIVDHAIALAIAAKLDTAS